MPWAPDDACARMFEGPGGPAAIAAAHARQKPFADHWESQLRHGRLGEPGP